MNTKIYIRDGRAPIPNDPKISVIMSANRGRNTNPELIFKRLLRRFKLSGYRSYLNVPGRPDLAFPKKKLAVFINGCFWHRCPYCNYPLPKSNRKFWSTKFKRNVLRDERKTKELKRLKWKVIVVWECKIKNDPNKAVQRVARALKY